jgi:hypothetical protein
MGTKPFVNPFKKPVPAATSEATTKSSDATHVPVATHREQIQVTKPVTAALQGPAVNAPAVAVAPTAPVAKPGPLLHCACCGAGSTRTDWSNLVHTSIGPVVACDHHSPAELQAALIRLKAVPTVGAPSTVTHKPEPIPASKPFVAAQQSVVKPPVAVQKPTQPAKPVVPLQGKK